MSDTVVCPQCGNSVEPLRMRPAVGVALIFLAVSAGAAGIILATLGANALGASGEIVTAVMWGAFILFAGLYAILRERMRGAGKKPIYHCHKCQRRFDGSTVRAI